MRNLKEGGETNYYKSLFLFIHITQLYSMTLTKLALVEALLKT